MMYNVSMSTPACALSHFSTTVNVLSLPSCPNKNVPNSKELPGPDVHPDETADENTEKIRDAAYRLYLTRVSVGCACSTPVPSFSNTRPKLLNFSILYV